MNVISCPRCLRQYDVAATMHGKLAGCRACKSTFFISVAEAASGEPAFSLIEPITPRYNFIRDGCAEMARNATDLLRLAGEPVTREAVMQLVQTAPRRPLDVGEEQWRRQFCNQTMKQAYFRCRETPDATRYREIFEYFTVYLPRRERDARDMLEGAFMGVFGVELEPDVLEVERVMWWERWFGRVAW